MRIRALATDYDDTIARAGVADPHVLNRLQLARRAGVKVLLVTGRRVPELQGVFDGIALVDLVVAENGGYLFAPASGVGWRIAPLVDQALVSALRERQVTPLYVGETIISTHDHQEPQVRDAIASLPSTTYRYDFIRNRESLMLLPQGIDKGSGLTEALRFLRIARAASVAIGDAENDIALLAAAGCGVAVADATHDLRVRAELVMAGEGPAGFVELVDSLVADSWELTRRRQARAG